MTQKIFSNLKIDAMFFNLNLENIFSLQSSIFLIKKIYLTIRTLVFFDALHRYIFRTATSCNQGPICFSPSHFLQIIPKNTLERKL